MVVGAAGDAARGGCVGVDLSKVYREFFDTLRVSTLDFGQQAQGQE